MLFYTNGETSMTAQQKQDLLDFIAKDGKGFIGVHTATATAYGWPEYGEMIGGYFDNHPWMIADAKIIVERPGFPAMKAFRTGMTVRDEHYEMTATPLRPMCNVSLLATMPRTSRGNDWQFCAYFDASFLRSPDHPGTKLAARTVS